LRVIFFVVKILLIEDEEKVIRFVVRGLQAEKFAVDFAKDGDTGLDMAETYSYDAIILDLNLPRMTGTEILKRLRKGNQTVPVLILTASDSVKTKVENFEAGADDYLTKPFSFAELLVRIKALIRRGAVKRESVLKIDGLEIDLMTHHVKRDGERIELTAKEFALLEYLATNRGRVLSRTMIIEHVWDQSFEGLTNIVDVYIRQLRAKIDEKRKVKLIKTIRGVGYTLSDEEPA